MPDIDQFEYLSNAAFTKNRLLFEDADLLRFYADDANEVDGERPIAMSLPELVSLVGGKLQFVHTQSTPLAAWAVEHNLGAQVDTVSIYFNGQLVYAITWAPWPFGISTFFPLVTMEPRQGLRTVLNWAV